METAIFMCTGFWYAKAGTHLGTQGFGYFESVLPGTSLQESEGRYPTGYPSLVSTEIVVLVAWILG